MLRYFITFGLNTKAHGGEALRRAVHTESKEEFNLLLRNGADINHIEPGDVGNFTILGCLLQTSVMASDLYFMHSLLAAGADGNTESGHWSTALQAVVERDRKEVFMELLRRGANINAKAGHYSTALTRAAFKRDEEMLVLLLEHGADVNIQHG
jgi:ankyrin repeat protein